MALRFHRDLGRQRLPCLSLPDVRTTKCCTDFKSGISSVLGLAALRVSGYSLGVTLIDDHPAPLELFPVLPSARVPFVGRDTIRKGVVRNSVDVVVLDIPGDALAGGRKEVIGEYQAGFAIHDNGGHKQKSSAFIRGGVDRHISLTELRESPVHNGSTVNQSRSTPR